MARCLLTIRNVTSPRTCKLRHISEENTTVPIRRRGLGSKWFTGGVVAAPLPIPVTRAVSSAEVVAASGHN
jgi:hypothetical protein